MCKKILIPIISLGVLLISTSVFAHSDTGMGAGFASGFMHPVLGWDHVAAMVAVGLWGAFLGSTAIWLLPVIFPVVMAFGGALGVAGIHIPSVETGIALSAIVLGLMVAFAIKPPLYVSAIIVGAFAIFHGHAHGTELPTAANPISYSMGFVISTGLLHLAGIAFGTLTKWSFGEVLVKLGGLVIAGAGVGFLTGWL